MNTEPLALAAGLDRAWADHRADVEEAIAAARRMRTGFARPAAPEAEPMPAYSAPEAEPMPAYSAPEAQPMPACRAPATPPAGEQGR